MSFKFRSQDERVGAGVRRIALAQVEAALLAAKDVSNPEETVHGLRRRCKKLRGLLRLIKPNFKHFARENDLVRAAANGLAGSRDAAVMIKTLESLRKQDVNLPIDAVRDVLRSNKEAAGAHSDTQKLLREFALSFEVLRARIPDWTVRGHGFDGLAGGLHDNYRRMRHGVAAAQASNDPNQFHEWRKGAKYFWHHLSLLSDCAPAVIEPYRAAVADLEAGLGDHHDLAVLDAFIGKLSDASVSSIQITLRQKRDRLGQQSLVLGRQVSAEKPDALVDRFAHYWALAQQGN